MSTTAGQGTSHLCYEFYLPDPVSQLLLMVVLYLLVKVPMDAHMGMFYEILLLK